MGRVGCVDSSEEEVANNALASPPFQRVDSTSDFVPVQYLASPFSTSAPSLFELVMTPKFLPFTFNFQHLFARGGWDPRYDTIRVHAESWHPGALEDNEFFIRYYNPVDEVVVVMTVRGMEVRVVSNLESECQSFFEGISKIANDFVIWSLLS